MSLTIVTFIKNWRGYAAGETAGFDDATATGLIAGEYAEAAKKGGKRPPKASDTKTPAGGKAPEKKPDTTGDEHKQPGDDGDDNDDEKP